MPAHRTPDVCRYCAVPLTDANWYPSQRRRSQKTCKACGQLLQAAHAKANPQYYRDASTASYRKLRAALFAAYGGSCACCGETESAFLTIDHVNGDGASHRAGVGDGTPAIYRWLRDRGFPREGFQLLCRNCNYGKYLCGECPHRTAQKQEAAT
jgi:hypothetical protein